MVTEACFFGSQFIGNESAAGSSLTKTIIPSRLRVRDKPTLSDDSYFVLNFLMPNTVFCPARKSGQNECTNIIFISQRLVLCCGDYANFTEKRYLYTRDLFATKINFQWKNFQFNVDYEKSSLFVYDLKKKKKFPLPLLHLIIQ